MNNFIPQLFETYPNKKRKIIFSWVYYKPKNYVRHLENACFHFLLYRIPSVYRPSVGLIPCASFSKDFWKIIFICKHIFGLLPIAEAIKYFSMKYITKLYKIKLEKTAEKHLYCILHNKKYQQIFQLFWKEISSQMAILNYLKVEFVLLLKFFRSSTSFFASILTDTCVT